MKRVSKRLYMLVAMVVSSASAWAQTEPGLWSFTQEMKMPGQPDMDARMAEMRQQLKDMPPETRKMLEQRMGVAMGDGNTIRVCITPEDAHRDPVTEGKRDKDCTYTQVRHEGNTWSGHLSCTSPPAEGDFQTTLHSPRHFVTTARMSSPHGRMEMRNEGKWVAADCGALARKPRP